MDQPVRKTSLTAPAGQALAMRGFDVRHLVGDPIRENRVLIDLLDVYLQLGVDVFARLRDFDMARVTRDIPSCSRSRMT